MKTTSIILLSVAGFIGSFGTSLVPLPLTTSDPVLEAVEDLLLRTYPSNAYRLQPEVRRVMGAISTTTDKLMASFAGPISDLPSGHTMITLSSNGSPLNVKALLYISVFDSVLTTVQRIAKGKRIDESNTAVVWRETTNKRSGILTSSSWAEMKHGVGDILASRHLADDRVLFLTDVEPSPDIKRGAQVTVTIAKGGIAISVHCVARESATIGDELRAYAKDISTMYRVRLTGDQTADWIETL